MPSLPYNAKVPPRPQAGPQVINEHAYIIGESGKLYGEIGEQAPEIFQDTGPGGRIIPTDRPYNPITEQGEFQSYLTGGELINAGVDPDLYANDPNVGAKLAALNASTSQQQAQSLAAGQIGQQVGKVLGQLPGSQQSQAIQPQGPLAAQQAAQQATQAAQAAYYNAQGNQLNAAGQTLAASQGIIPLTQADINANRNVQVAQGALIPSKEAQLGAQGNTITANTNVVRAQQGTNAPAEAIIGAKGQVLTAQQAQDAENRKYIQDLTNVTSARLGETQAIQAARYGPDEIRAAADRTARASTDYQYSLAGVATPQDVIAPPGAILPSGTRGKIESQADTLGREANDRNEVRNLQLQQAQNAVALLGTDVVAAQRVAERAGLTLDQAQLLVTKAQQEANLAGLTEQEAGRQTAIRGLDVERATNTAAGTQLDIAQGQLGVEQAKLNEQATSLASQQAGLNVNKAQLLEAVTGLAPKAGQQIYLNPYTLQSEYLTPAEKIARETADQKQMAVSQPNLTKYTDPDTGLVEYITPAEADRREIGYKKRLAREVAGTQYGDDELGGFTEANILQRVRDRDISPEQAYRVLVTRGNAGDKNWQSQVWIKVTEALRNSEERGTSSDSGAAAFGAPLPGQ